MPFRASRRRNDHTHRRHLPSAMALSQFRRLALPVVLAQVSATTAPRPELGQLR